MISKSAGALEWTLPVYIRVVTAAILLLCPPYSPLKKKKNNNKKTTVHVPRGRIISFTFRHTKVVFVLRETIYTEVYYYRSLYRVRSVGKQTMGQRACNCTYWIVQPGSEIRWIFLFFEVEYNIMKIYMARPAESNGRRGRTRFPDRS